MAKKIYYVAPTITETEIQPTVILTGSNKVTVDGDKILDYDPTQGDASGGQGRRTHHDVWGEEEEDY